MSERESRIRSAVLGATVGDALGVPVEFQGRARRREDPVSGMREYGTHHQPAGTWSDDTSMILATMTGFCRVAGYQAEAVMKEFAAWVYDGAHTPHGEVFDIGNATHGAIKRYRMGTPAAECGGTAEWSNGNGSLMRILPVGLAWAEHPELVSRASEISALTHAHERSRFCCVFYCLVVKHLLREKGIEAAALEAWQELEGRWKFSVEERPRFERRHPERLFVREEDGIASGGHVIDTLEAALWVNFRHDNYADAVLHAVNLGDDTDTTGCVAGGLAGLLHGESGIPGPWLKVLVKRSEIETLCTSFSLVG